MSEKTYKQTEKIIIILMLVGMLAMFQPWFSNMAGLFDPLTAEGGLSRLYSREIAPTVFRYGFYIVLLSTIGFIVWSHYTADDLTRAMDEKGKVLTWLLVALPVVIGYTLIVNLSVGLGTAALLGVVAFIGAIALWSWQRWGFISYALISLAWMGMAAADLADGVTAVIHLVLTIIIGALLWPRREQLL